MANVRKPLWDKGFIGIHWLTLIRKSGTLDVFLENWRSPESGKRKRFCPSQTFQSLLTKQSSKNLTLLVWQVRNQTVSKCKTRNSQWEEPKRQNGIGSEPSPSGTWKKNPKLTGNSTRQSYRHWQGQVIPSWLKPIATVKPSVSLGKQPKSPVHSRSLIHTYAIHPRWWNEQK